MSFGLKLARFEFVFDLLKLKLAWVYLSLSWYPMLLLLLLLLLPVCWSRSWLSYGCQSQSPGKSELGLGDWDSLTRRLRSYCAAWFMARDWPKAAATTTIRNCTNIFQFVACISQPIAWIVHIVYIHIFIYILNSWISARLILIAFHKFLHCQYWTKDLGNERGSCRHLFVHTTFVRLSVRPSVWLAVRLYVIGHLVSCLCTIINYSQSLLCHMQMPPQPEPIIIIII